MSNANSLYTLAATVEQETNEQNDEEILNNFLGEKVGDRVTQALLQYGKGVNTSGEPQHVKSLRRCLLEHDQKLPKAIEELRGASEKLSSISAKMTDARKAKAEADQALLSAIMSKSELEKRFTPSAIGGTSTLPASAINIMKKCDERIRSAQASQLECGERITEIREQLEEITNASAQSRKENLQMIENVEKRKLNSIAMAANEILALQLLLSRSLVHETDGIVDMGADRAVIAAGSANASLNSSIASSAGGASSIYSTMNGFDWVERILRMEPSERSLFFLQNIAEEVTLHESEDETKITDLEHEIERLKQQIFELGEGKGAFADRLAADYASSNNGQHQGGDLKGTGAVRGAIPQFSLLLPLKTDCYDANFWQGFSVEERHDELKKMIQLPYIENSGDAQATQILNRGAILSEHEWDIIAYEQVMLGYFEISSRYPHIMSNSAWNKLKSVVQLCRLKLKIPTKTHEAITELLLPDTMCVQDEISPLDIRFRVIRMIALSENWSMSEPGVYRDWMRRQVALLDLGIRCWGKEDLTNFISQSVSPIMAVVLSAVSNNESTIETDVLVELLEMLTTFAEEKCESTNLASPRGVFHQIISRIWRLCIDLNEENGLHSDTPNVASFLNNFITGRQYPYHAIWVATSLWETAVANSPSIPASLATQVNNIIAPGDKWLEKVSGDTFWFGNGKNESSICASPISKTSSASRASLMDKNAEGGISDDVSRIIAFDLAYQNFFTCKSRDNIVNCLCDYRAKLEPESLEICVDIFRNIMNRSNTMVPMYMWPSDADYSGFFECMCEFFISESAHTICNRLIEPNKYLDSVSVARAHANDESRGIWISDVTDAIWKVIFEYNCEMEVYSIAWKRFNLTSKHSLIWSKGLQSRIRAVVELINRDDDLWITDRVPPNGQDLLAVLQVWERVSKDGGLTDVIRPKITRSLGLHLDKVERDSLPSCLHENISQSWEPTRKPTILHSTKCVDLWTTIFTSIQACIDAASAQLSMGTCAQMIVRCVEKFCDNAKEGFVYDIGYAHPLYIKSRRAFNRLIRSVEDETDLPDLFKNKKKRKSRLFKRESNTATSSAVNSGGEESDGDGSIVAASTSVPKKSDTNLIGDNHLFLSDYLQSTCKWASHQDTSLMVRLHDFAFSIGELEKVRETLKESMQKEHVRLSRLFQSHAQDGEVVPATIDLPRLPAESLAAMHESIESGITEATAILTSSGNLISQYLGINMVFLFLREDLFEKLYMPTPRENPLGKILKTFDHNKLTVFSLMAPAKWRKDVCRSILVSFVYAWVYVVIDMASRGRIFKESDSAVMNNDLTALHELADQLKLKDDDDSQEILRTVGCLPVYVSGSTLAEFKINCEKALADPTEKSKGKSRLAATKPAAVTSSSYGKKPIK